MSYRPFLIKPNHHELSAIFNTEISTCEQAYHYGGKLIEKGAKNAIVSLGDKGAVFMNGQGTCHNCPCSKRRGKKLVGAGDSMVAGFLAKYEETKDVSVSFRYSVAAGSASAFSIGLCTKEKVEQLYPLVILKNHFTER